MSGGDLDNSFPDDLDELDDSEVGELVWPQFLLLFVNVNCMAQVLVVLLYWYLLYLFCFIKICLYKMFVVKKNNFFLEFTPPLQTKLF
jgi:hypothetical protein